MLSRSVRQKKLEKKGVDALFSREEEKGRPGPFIGSLAILLGVALWTVNIAGVQSPNYFGPGGLDSYTLLVLAPLGLLFVVCGAGLSLSSRSIPGLQPGEALTPDLEGAAKPPSPTRQNSITSLRLGIAVFLESFLVVTLYAGVLDEYQSNLRMRDWVRRTLPTVEVLLSYEALIITSGIISILIIQFLPGQAFNKQVP